MRPLILDYALPMKENNYIIYEYDRELSLNVVKDQVPKIPFIDLSEETVLLTNTRVSREQNDSLHHLLEFGRKTEVKRERDDQHISPYLELVKKTFVKRERDDENSLNN